MPIDTKSTVQRMGKIVTQIIHFSNGNKRTFHNIITETIQDGSMTKMRTADGRMIMVNGDNVDCIEILPDDRSQPYTDRSYEENPVTLEGHRYDEPPIHSHITTSHYPYGK